VQVGSSYLPALPIATDYRRGGYERAPRAQPAGERTDQQTQQGEITRIRTRASAAAQSSEQRPAFIADNVSGRNRAALQTYQSNGPSIEERLGVELVGVDTFA